VPTTRPRHTITETAPVQEALDELRRELGDDRVEFPDLVIRGARHKVRELRTQSSADGRKLDSLVGAIKARELGLDPTIAGAARRAWLPE
jgi:hypothetical protein